MILSRNSQSAERRHCSLLCAAGTQQIITFEHVRNPGNQGPGQQPKKNGGDLKGYLILVGNFVACGSWVVGAGDKLAVFCSVFCAAVLLEHQPEATRRARHPAGDSGPLLLFCSLFLCSRSPKPRHLCTRLLFICHLSRVQNLWFGRLPLL